MTRVTAAGARITRWLTDGSARHDSDERVTRRAHRAVTWARQHPMTVDAVLAMAIAAFALPQLRYWYQQDAGFTIRLVLSVLLIAPVIWRRRYPLSVFALASAVALVQWSLSISLAADVVLLVYLYTVASRFPARVALLAAGVLEVGVVLAATRWNLAGDLAQPLLLRVAYLSGLVAVALLLGVSMRVRRQALEALTERAEHLERERDQQAAIATAHERARIAREMHDVVAHGLTVMVTLSQAAARATSADPRRAAATMEQVAATGRLALDEMRGLLDVLRSDGDTGGRRPQPGIVDLDDLLVRIRDAGLDITVALPDEPSELPPALQLTVHRIVQEAVTNTIKHAVAPTRIDVRVERGPDAVTVAVTDNGAAPPTTPGTGLGLLGMRERAAVHGGCVDAGPTRSGGWTVHAHLPVRRRVDEQIRRPGDAA